MKSQNKFRVWDHQTSTFSFFGLRELFGHLPNDIPDNQICQFTGLQDNFWQDVYEGDVVRISESNDPEDPSWFVGDVSFVNGGFRIGRTEPITDYICCDGKRYYFDGEVIGNIFEQKII